MENASKIRLLMIVFIFAAIFSLLYLNLFGIQVIDGANYSARQSKQSNSIKIVIIPRGMICDVSGIPLAVSEKRISVFCNPRLVKDEKSRKLIGALIHSDNQEKIDSILVGDREFSWVRRFIPEKEFESILEKFCQIKNGKKILPDGFGQMTEYARVYPYGNVYSHLLGFCDIDLKGLEGIEKLCNKFLPVERTTVPVLVDATRHVVQSLGAEPDPELASVVLTVDNTVQTALYQSLLEAHKKYQTKRAIAIAMNPQTGAILGIVCLPDFDPANPGAYPPEVRRNFALTDPIEPGSVLKPLVVSGALELKVVTPDTRINCEGGKYNLGYRTIADTQGHGILSVRDVIVQSSNVGAVKIGMMLGAHDLRRTLACFGLGQRTGIEIQGEAAGFLRPEEKWTKYTTTSVPMGYEIMTTPLQLVTAFSAIANGGILVTPHVVDSVYVGDKLAFKRFTEQKRRVISAETAAAMRGILREVVKRGTAKEINLDWISLAGKTGTAKKLEGGVYTSGKHTAIFIGFAPADDAKICVAIIMDEPHGAYYGGKVSAPVFKSVIEKLRDYMFQDQKSELRGGKECKANGSQN